MSQSTNHILMIEPAAFNYNPETAENNYYQVLSNLSDGEIQQRALEEFNAFVQKLNSNGIDITVIKDKIENGTPDSIFPNNWVSFHTSGNVILYPMYAPTRRKERRQDILDTLKEKFEVGEIIDFTGSEDQGVFLEGTGSIILDRPNRIAYAAISQRTDKKLFEEFCKKMDYKPISFTAYQTVEDKRLPIYHTNVMMEVGTEIAVVCLECIDDPGERESLKISLENSDKEIIEISEDQVENFAGNMLEVQDKQGNCYQVMSSAAYNSLSQDQIERIESHCKIIHSSLDTIESNGGGSARCMMAEIFLPEKS